MSRRLHRGCDLPDLTNRFHEFGIPRFEPGSNVVTEGALNGNIALDDLKPERFFGFSAQFLSLKSQVRTNGFDNGPLDVVRSVDEPIQGLFAERNEQCGGFEPILRRLHVLKALLRSGDGHFEFAPPRQEFVIGDDLAYPQVGERFDLPAKCDERLPNLFLGGLIGVRRSSACFCSRRTQF